MVLVGVSKDDRLDVLRALAEVGEVRQDEIDAELVGRREHQAGVHHHDPAVELDDRHVLADLAEPAEWQDTERPAGQTLASRPWRSSASRATGFSSSLPSTRGRRGAPTSWPSMSKAALIGTGPVVTVKALNRSLSESCISCRASGSSIIRRISVPTRWEATRMPPVPPASSVSAKVSSLPASRSSPSIGAMSSNRACLTADTFAISAASSAMNSLGMSITDRDGML